MPTYIESEQSVEDGFSTEIFKFSSDGFTTSYFYTSADEEITYNSDVYTPIEIARSQPELSRERGGQLLEITVPRTNAVAMLWQKFVPPRTVWLTVYRYHRSESGTPEVVVFWQGKVRGVVWSNNQANIQCMPIDTAFSRNGLRVIYGGTCRHQLYGDKCAVPLNLFSKNITVTGISGNTIQSPDLVTVTDGITPAPDGWWTAGFVQSADTQVRFITNHVSTEIELLVAIEGLQAGDVLLAAAGCDHRASTCGQPGSGKFGNIVNFGGLGLYVPEFSPFSIKLGG